MILSTLGWCGSVKSKNFVPVTVWKHVSRKVPDSSTSKPVRSEAGMPRVEGVRDLVMAWTLVSHWALELELSFGVDGGLTHERCLLARGSR